MIDEKLPLLENYTRHLLVWQHRHTIDVVEDIVATNRQVIVTRGKRFDDACAALLQGKNLLQPLSVCLRVVEAFNGDALYAKLVGYFAEDLVLKELFVRFPCAEQLAIYCQRATGEPSIAQHLWLLHLSAPRIFERALFCAWFMLVLHRYQRQLTEDQTLYDVFLAGLVHDLGLLYLDPKVVSESHQSGTDLWREYIHHPEVGYEILLYFSDVSSCVTRAVREHHEELDGTGFPAGKLAKQLAPQGRYLQLLDSTHAIYSKYFRPRARTLADVVPIIQMNHLSKPGQPAADLIVLLRQGTASSSCSVPDELMPLLIAQVRERHLYIKQFVEQADVFLEQNQLAIANARFFALHSLLQHITLAMKQSGLINDAYIRWLDQVEKENLAHAYREVEDVFLMMQEILYHIRRFTLHLRRFSELEARERTQLTPIWAPTKSIPLIPPGQASSVESIRQSLASFNETREPHIPPELDTLWLTHVRELKRH